MTHNAASLRAKGMKRKTDGAKTAEISEEWKAFLATLRDARMELNLSHRELAEAIGVTLPQISGWERGVNCPHPHDLLTWMRHLGLTLTAAPNK